MATVNLKLPDLRMEDFEDDAKLQKIISYLYQLNEQLRYELTHIDDDNISADGVSAEALTGTINRTITNDKDEALQLYASARQLMVQLSAKVEDDLGKVEERILTVEANNEQFLVEAKEYTDDAVDGIDTIDNSALTISPQGIKIKSTGTFTVDSSKFDIDENGEMSAVNARISGQLSVDENEVWHKGILVVSTVTPETPSEGMIWVKPDTTSIPAAGTWTAAARDSRYWQNNYVVELEGANIGSAPGNATYTYEVSVPVYYNYNKTNDCTCTVYLAASSGGKDIAFAAQTYNHKNAGGNTYKASVKSTKWLGNAKKIYLLIVFSDGNAMAVNSHSPFSCTLTAKTNSAAGWKPCEVQMYAG